MPRIKPIFLCHVLVTVVLSGLVYAVIAPRQGASSLLAGTIVGANLLLWIWSMGRIFAKKSVALAITLIVIKYAALLVALIVLLAKGWRADMGFLIGLSSLFPTVGFIAYQHQRRLDNDGAF